MNSNIEIINQFEALQKEFHRCSGSLIHTLDENLAKKYIAELSWNDCFNPYVPGVMLSQAKLDIDVFGHTFQVELWKPIKFVSRYEFENFFGFLSREYVSNSVVAQFSKDINPKIDVRKLLSSVKIRRWEEEKDIVFDVVVSKGLPNELFEQIFNQLKKDDEEQFVRDVLRLMVLGGYVKYWEAITKYQQWFKEQGNDVDLKSTSRLIFE